MTGLEDLAFLVVLAADLWEHLVEVFLLFVSWGTELDKLDISRSLVATLDKAFDSGHEVFDIGEIVFVGWLAVVPGYLFS